MDPLSISASIIAVLQATNAIVSVCYDFRAVMKKTPWSLTYIIQELKDLRNVLETLDRLADAFDDTPALNMQRRPAFELLCEPGRGPLASCLRELTYLEKKITSSSRVGKSDSKISAFMQVMCWQLKDRDARLCIERIERCKSTLNLAITADEATLILDIQKMTTSLNNTLQDIGNDVSSLLGNQHSKGLDERRKSIVQWLSPCDPWEIHETAVKVHQQGTSDWFIESKEFSDWYHADHSSLWLSGFPGSGKTILFSNAITYLTRNLSNLSEVAGMAYFYCDFRSDESQKPINVIGSLVAQLCSQLGCYPEELELAYDRSNTMGGQRRRPTLLVLMHTLQSFARDNKIILLIDALDECSNRKDLIDFICKIPEEMRHIKILITSRDELDIQEAFRPFTRLRIESHLDEIDQDIRYYIDQCFHSDRQLQWLNSSVKIDIASSLNSKSAGMFRWVQCQLDAIAMLRTIKAIRIALHELPEGLNETYENILKKISKSNVEIVRRILLWLSFAVLPLTLDEIHEAIAIEQNLDHLDEESCLSSPQEILTMCGSLVNVSEQGHVRLAHLSVKEYLLSSEIRRNSSVSNFAMLPGEANNELATACLTYLFFGDLANGPSPTSNDFVDRLKRHLLLRHTATGWAYYARASSPTPKLNDLIFKFFSPLSRQNFMSWVQILNADYNFKWDLYPKDATPLYYAASFGLEEVVEALIKNGADLNARGSRFGGTALHGAVLRFHIPVMKLLLDAGADATRADFNRVTPLHTAVVHGNIEVISLLLKFGASKDAVDDVGETPLVWAKKAEQRESQNLLLGLEAKARDTATESPQQEVWKRSVPYFPDFYGRRSGLDSSIVLSVEVGTTRRVLR